MIPGIIAILSSAVVSLWVFLRARTIQVEQLKWERDLAKLDVQLGEAAKDARKKDAEYDEWVQKFHDSFTDPLQPGDSSAPKPD